MYIVTSVTGNHQDDLDATLKYLFQVTFTMLSILCFNSYLLARVTCKFFLMHCFIFHLGDACDSTLQHLSARSEIPLCRLRRFLFHVLWSSLSRDQQTRCYIFFSNLKTVLMTSKRPLSPRRNIFPLGLYTRFWCQCCNVTTGLRGKLSRTGAMRAYVEKDMICPRVCAGAVLSNRSVVRP